MRIKNLIVFCLSLAIVAADQATKLIALNDFYEGESVSVIPGFFNLTLTFNKGVAFGLLADLPDPTRQVLIASATLTALGVIFFLLIKHYRHDFVAQLALAAIVGGALGNIIDRLRLGKVVDFLDFYYASYHWPAFNLADSAVCLGVLVLMFRPTKACKVSPAATKAVS
ncbi:MAG: signal peptidase II [Deltaproteobacteria bacterium]|nr:signal peptidase II [Deltaproteobacteria bacterium]